MILPTKYFVLLCQHLIFLLPFSFIEIYFGHTFLHFWWLLFFALPIIPLFINIFSFDCFNRIHLPFFKFRVEVDMLWGILCSVEPVHIKLPNKRCHILMFEVFREDLFCELGNIDDMESILFAQPTNVIFEIRILRYFKSLHPK